MVNRIIIALYLTFLEIVETLDHPPLRELLIQVPPTVFIQAFV